LRVRVPLRRVLPKGRRMGARGGYPPQPVCSDNPSMLVALALEELPAN
jgi:hypothetical protein